MSQKTLTFDVTEAVGASTSQHVAAWLFLPPKARLGAATRLLVCLPGGTYDKRYYHMEIPGHPGYSMAERLAQAGHVVLSVDHWGVGESSRPESAAGVTAEAVAAANHAVGVEALRRARQGELDPGLTPLPDITSVGIGHSMGGMLTIVQQAAHRTHRQICILGKSAFQHNRAHFTDAGRASMRAVDVTAYRFGDRGQLRQAFYWHDVPEAVIAFDTASAVEVPGPLAARTSGDNVALDDAAKIEVPVFIGVGERDTVLSAHEEARYYPASSDITVYLLPRSAHCHNFASTRAQLWDRVIRWIPTVD